MWHWEPSFRVLSHSDIQTAVCVHRNQHQAAHDTCQDSPGTITITHLKQSPLLIWNNHHYSPGTITITHLEQLPLLTWYNYHYSPGALTHLHQLPITRHHHNSSVTSCDLPHVTTGQQSQRNDARESINS